MPWASIKGWLRDARAAWLSHRREQEIGQGLVEYALILVFVAVVMILVMTILGPGISNIYKNIVTILQNR